MTLCCQGKPEGCKLLRIETEIDHAEGSSPTIRNLSIKGDFFAVPEETFDILEASLRDIPLEGFAALFDSRAEKMGLRLAGISGEGLETVLRSCIDVS